MLKQLFYIALGGSLGALGRYGLAGLVQRHSNSIFPWGTLAVNVLGCFVIGLAYEFTTQIQVAPGFRMFFLVGLLGAFTTFSTYSYESLGLLRDGEIWPGLANIFASNILGIGAALAGVFATRGLLALFK